MAHWIRFILNSIDRSVPPNLRDDPEETRRARLIVRLGLLGSVFGGGYATFYFLINHIWGALIIVVCSLLVCLTPAVMRCTGSIPRAGHLMSLILVCGFTALCFVEGGLRGHAIAWLVSIPLCALLLVGKRAARSWGAICLLAAGLVAALDLAGIRLPHTYDESWHSVISTAGFFGLILFMFLLGMIFETGRADAFSKMQATLHDLAIANERLTMLNKEKNEFLGIAAHDLKNPLTTIIGSADMLTLSKDASRSQRLAKMIMDAAKRMRHLITDLLDANAIEEGRFTSNIQPHDLSHLVELCCNDNRSMADRKQIVIEQRLESSLWAMTDESATRQILDNLLSNAIKYSPFNTTVHVYGCRRKDRIQVSIRDEGPGISDEDQRRLFKKFTRLSARPTGGESSTGLGLSIVRKLAEALSGTVECDSTPGAGSTFTLSLPVAQLPPDPSGPPGFPCAILETTESDLASSNHLVKDKG